MDGFTDYLKICRRSRRTKIDQRILSGATLKNPKNAVLFLDFDGTLAPIQEKPDLVHLPENHLLSLKTLSSLIPVFVLSGRSIPDLQKRLPVTDLAGVSGDHGASRIYRGEVFLEPNAEIARAQLTPLETMLKELPEQWPGVFIERKQFSLSIHYRQLSIEKQEAFISFMEKIFHQATTKILEMRHGKCVLEFRHPEINKESALKWFLKRVSEERNSGNASGSSLFPIMVGDDITDWNAIKTAINLGGVGIWVGDRPPERHVPAAARLSSPEEVWNFLNHSLKPPLQRGISL